MFLHEGEDGEDVHGDGQHSPAHQEAAPHLITKALQQFGQCHKKV